MRIVIALGGARAFIGALTDAEAVLAGSAGTCVRADADGPSWWD